MATITAALVKELRDMTGAGMMDCKSALSETDGNVEAAVDWLRTKGLAKAAKKADRVAAEGLVAARTSGVNGTVIEMNAETDFVARNEDFQKLTGSVASVALAANANDAAALASAAYPSGGTVADAISSAIATIGENMSLRRVSTMSVGQGIVASYVHASVGEDMGRIAVLVGLESSAAAAGLADIGRKVAMHVAASSPVALESSAIDPAVLEREKNVLAEKNAGKPPQVMEKIIESGLKTYFKEVCLLEQAFIHDTSKSVSQAVAEVGKAAGADIKITGFVRYQVGEGIEKAESDFAAEVAGMAG
ncbi:MAG: translation elongation factor Ts [Beijerinckiaceae bacterium]|nr:translation elongation factor Ts [Beijerinckiaceae bacterium]